MENRKIILHSDGARSYKLKLKDVFHHWVVHRKKLRKIRAKKVWVTYVRKSFHKLPSGRKLWVKGGAQIIDRAWQVIRKHLGPRTKQGPGTAALERRAFGTVVLLKRKNLWFESSKMIQTLV